LLSVIEPPFTFIAFAPNPPGAGLIRIEPEYRRIARGDRAEGPANALDMRLLAGIGVWTGVQMESRPHGLLDIGKSQFAGKLKGHSIYAWPNEFFIKTQAIALVCS
jgi:hypothetical protein